MNRRKFVSYPAAATGRRVLFALGEVSTTHAALERLHALGLEPSDLIARHQVGDWGEVDDTDYAMNEEGLHQEQRVFSSYEIENERFWVLTAADRSSTIVFLPGHAPADPA